MLVLTRKANESLKIADHIEVRVLAVKGKQVRLGIVAPPEIPVRRYEAKKKAA